MRPYKKEVEFSQEPLIIGYYPFRGKAQLSRLLCQYLHVSYVNKFFTPDEWSKFKENEAKDWVVRDFPFCKDGDFIVTGLAVSSYIIFKAGRNDLLGRNLADRIKIDSIKSKHDLKSAILGLICTYRPSNSQEGKIISLWGSKIEPILMDYEADCPEEGWYYGYVTIMDFLIYQILNLISYMFPDEVKKFKKLFALRERFRSIPEIKNYETSDRLVSEYSPVAYFSQFKEQKMKMNKSPHHKESPMDIE